MIFFGTVAKLNTAKEIFTYILTGDKDSLQLISDMTSIVMPSSKMGKTEYVLYTPELLMEKQGIIPKQVIDVKSLMGDSSDNIPGVPGIGEKTAYALIEKYGSLDNIYASIDSIQCTPSVKKKLIENKEMAYLSYKLATIDTNVSFNMDYNLLKLTDVNIHELTSLFERLSFKKFLERYKLDGSSIPKTDNNIEFFKSFDANNVFDIKNNIDMFNVQLSIAKENLSTIVITIINNKKLGIENILAFYINGKVMYVSLDDDLSISVLKDVAICKCNKIGYDIKRIYNICLKNKINSFLNFKSDIKIAYYLLHSSENNYEIENISYNLLGINMPSEDIRENDVEKKEEQTSLFDTIPLEDKQIQMSETKKKYIYATVKAIFSIDDILKDKLDKFDMSNLYNDIEMPLIETLADIEHNGMYINKERLLNFGKELSLEITKLEDKIYEISGNGFNINSPAQLGKILYDTLGLSTSKKTKKGYSTDKETLESLIGEHEIIKYILDYRAMAKLKSTYVDGLIECIADDTRVHTTFMQTVTATGRLSSVDPNLQNIPVRTELGSKIRECFEAEDENVIIDADYSQIELRVLAHMAQDNTMIRAFNQGQDIHAITASEVFKVPLEEVSHELRSKAKAVNFGIVYGISGFGLAKNINSTRAEASKYIEDYLTHYYKVKEFMEEKIREGKENGYVSTLFGRIRYTEELKASNKNTVMFGERIAMNTPIQGTAADIIKKAMNTLYIKLKQRGLKSKIIMQVHDELLVEAPKEEKDEVIKIMKDSMQNVIKLDVPLDVSINVGKTWSEAK